MKIRVLRDEVINQIAAGEVVDRPVAVVRELVDNAVDAGATQVSIYVEDGGRSLVRVVDNGCGMIKDDAILSFERHATSKLTETTDLNSISTLGFRGEALPSIAAIARIRMRTRARSSDYGSELLVDAGVFREVKQISFSCGTDVEVRNLFFNTPVRKKFLSSSQNESAKIKQWLLGFSLGHPEIHWRLYLDQNEVANYPQDQDCLARGQRFIRGSALKFSAVRDEMRVTGMVAHPSLAQFDSNSFTILVNGRVVSDRTVLRAVKEGFDSTLKDREFPLGFINLELGSDRVDVNVHPQKSEVRFRETGAVFVFVRDTVLEHIKDFRAPLVLEGKSSFNPSSAQVIKFPELRQERLGEQVALVEQVSATEFRSAPTALAVAEATDPYPSHLVERLRFSELKFIGQALGCYLFCELNDQVYCLDMHAAHERYNYNLIRAAIDRRDLPVQRLLIPCLVDLGETGVLNCMTHRAVFERFGFEIEAKDDQFLAVRTHPAILAAQDIPVVVKEVAALELDQLAEGVFREKLDHIAARIACHASIRSGKVMRPEEVLALLEGLDRTEFSGACPHGRPVVVKFSQSDIEHWFGRDR